MIRDLVIFAAVMCAWVLLGIPFAVAVGRACARRTLIELGWEEK